MTEEEIEFLKNYSEKEQLEIVNKKYTKEEVVNMSKAEIEAAQKMKIIYAKRKEEKEETDAAVEKKKEEDDHKRKSIIKKIFWRFNNTYSNLNVLFTYGVMLVFLYFTSSSLSDCGISFSDLIDLINTLETPDNPEPKILCPEAVGQWTETTKGEVYLFACIFLVPLFGYFLGWINQNKYNELKN
tara:strand:+ start:198 stop:752 length:555 start_codon:yes stop_codon:yes gene_type:complete